MAIFSAAIFVLSGILPARAAEVLTDIAPVHSVVAKVAGEHISPGLLVADGTDPHHASLRPSQVRTLARADLLIWIGPELTPWLGEAAERVNPDLARLELGEGEAEHDHEHEAGHEGEGEAHPWLDPLAVAEWPAQIAAALAQVDPANADDYRQNAETVRSELVDLGAEIEASLSGAGNPRLLVGHDAYSAFAERFGLRIVGAIADSEARAPGAARLSELAELVAQGGVDCVLYEPGPSKDYARVVAGGKIPMVAIDPSGAGLMPGPDHYAELLRSLARSINACRS